MDARTVEILKNEYGEALSILNPENVKITRLEPPAGSLVLLLVRVNAPTYIITGVGDNDPKPVDSIEFYVDIKFGYPKTKPVVSFKSGKIHAGINTFLSGNECIDDWHYDEVNSARNSSLAGTLRKTIMDIIYDPSVSNYKSMANASLEKWQKSKVLNGEFPTVSLNHVFRDEDSSANKRRPELPARHTTTKVMPPLPSRNR